MAHHLEQYVTKLHIDNYLDCMSIYRGLDSESLDDQFTNMTGTFNTLEESTSFWLPHLQPIFGNCNIEFSTNLRFNNGCELLPYVSTPNGWDVDDTITIYTATLFVKYNPTQHKPTYFCDNTHKVNEYKPADIIEGDCLIAPSNLYRREPKNFGQECKIIASCVFTPLG